MGFAMDFVWDLIILQHHATNWEKKIYRQSENNLKRWEIIWLKSARKK